MNAQIRVLVSQVVDGQISFRQMHDGVTNDRGDYRIAGLAKGEIHRLFELNQRANRCRDMLSGIRRRRCGQRDGSSRRTRNQSGFHIDLDTGYTHSGAVSGAPAGRGVGDSLIKRGAQSGPYGMYGRENKNGFNILAAPGSYTLAADCFEAGKHLLARVPIEACTSDIDNVAVTLDRGLTIAGTVEIPSQPGQPVARPQFDIRLRPSEPMNGIGQAKWDKDHASFTFEDLAPGIYRRRRGRCGRITSHGGIMR